MNYAHFELKNVEIQENKFPRLVYIELHRTCFIFLLLFFFLAWLLQQINSVW